MHILQLTPYYAPAYSYGGVVRAVQGMAEALVQRGHRVTVLTTDTLSREQRYTGASGASGASDEMLNGVRILRYRNLFPLLRARANLSTPFGMRNDLKALLADVDVLHTHEFRSLENLLVLSVAAKHNIPVVLSAHGTLRHSTGRTLLKQGWDKIFSPPMAGYIQHIIALAAQEKSEISAVWQPFGTIPPISIIPNGINPADFASLPDANPFREKYGLHDKKVILFLGRLHPRKGVEVLVRAFNTAKMPDTCLVLAGPDEGMIDTLQPLLNKNVILTGYIAGHERLQTLAAADVFVLPAIGEGLSMAVLEAMAAGLPVILSPGCNLPEAEAAGAGIITEPEPEPLTVALQTLLSDNKKRQHMSAAATKLVHSQFTWAIVAQQLEQVYQSL